MIETQYLDIFNAHRNIIDQNSVSALNNLRNKAYETFKRLGFPTKKDEDFKHIDIAECFKPNFGLNLNRIPFTGNPYKTFKCDVHDLSTNLYFILNDLFHAEYIPKTEYPKGVFVGSIKDFAVVNPSVLDKYYGKAANIETNQIAAFNTMFAQDGLVIYVPKGVVLEKPIQLINLLKSTHDYLVNRRILIIAEENAQVKILACDHTMDESNFLVTQVTEIFAAKDALVDFYELEENSDRVTRLASTYIQQDTNSNVLTNNITLNCGKTRNNYSVNLLGQHAETYVCGMVISDKNQYVDNFIFIDHLVPNCTSTQLFKYVLQDNSIGAFCGRIRVEKDAQKTLAYQTNNNLCASPNAQMFAKPQLEIYADDVKCSHGMTTGQLNEDALLYLRSRGIAEKEARLLLMQAFTADVLNHVRIHELRIRLEDLIERRFKGEIARCSSCAVYK